MNPFKTLSEFVPTGRHGLTAFMGLCSWRKHRARMPGDVKLLGLLDEALRRLPYNTDGSLAQVAELPDTLVHEAVGEVAEEFGGWTLDGGPTGSILDRLDAHFRVVQDEQCVVMRERMLDAERMAKASAELDVQIAARDAKATAAAWSDWVAIAALDPDELTDVPSDA